MSPGTRARDDTCRVGLRHFPVSGRYSLRVLGHKPTGRLYVTSGKQFLQLRYWARKVAPLYHFKNWSWGKNVIFETVKGWAAKVYQRSYRLLESERSCWVLSTHSFLLNSTGTKWEKSTVVVFKGSRAVIVPLKSFFSFVVCVHVGRCLLTSFYLERKYE